MCGLDRKSRDTWTMILISLFQGLEELETGQLHRKDSYKYTNDGVNEMHVWRIKTQLFAWSKENAFSPKVWDVQKYEYYETRQQPTNKHCWMNSITYHWFVYFSAGGYVCSWVRKYCSLLLVGNDKQGKKRERRNKRPRKLLSTTASKPGVSWIQCLVNKWSMGYVREYLWT